MPVIVFLAGFCTSTLTIKARSVCPVGPVMLRTGPVPLSALFAYTTGAPTSTGVAAAIRPGMHRADIPAKNSISEKALFL